MYVLTNACKLLCRNMSFSCTYGDARYGKQTAQRRQVGKKTKTISHEGALLKDLSWPFPSNSLFMTGDLNHRNTGQPPITMAWSVWMREEAGGSRVRVKDQNRKSWNWGKGREKCSLWFALVCLLTVCSELPLCSGQCSWNEGYCLNPPAEHLIKE